MATSYKFYYFNITARGELSRWIFAQAGVKYEDVRIAGEQWPKKKPETPFGQLPVLEVNENGTCTQIPQSGAIERYLAREFNLAGSTSLEKARGDFLNEYLNDTNGKLPFGEKNKEKQKVMMKEAMDGPVASNLAVLEKYVGSSGFLVGDSITWADMSFATKAEYFLEVSPKVLDKTPKLKNLYEKVISLPNIAAWISKRPS